MNRIIHLYTKANGAFDLGECGVVRIEEHAAQGDGDRWYYDVFFDDGAVIRQFVFYAAEFASDEEEAEYARN